MKNIILLISLFVTLTGFTQQIITPPNASRTEVKLIKRVVNDYLNDEKAIVMYNPYSPLFIGFYGITYQYDKNFCLFSLSAALSDRDKRTWVLLHEMGHVLDIMYGDLSEYPPMWKGKRMERGLEWHERPWEQHADEWAERLWKRYIDGDPPKDKIYNEMGHPNDCILKQVGNFQFTPPLITD